jgi:hypothetical protein
MEKGFHFLSAENTNLKHHEVQLKEKDTREIILNHNTLTRYEKSIVTKYKFILSFKLS